MIGRDLVPLSLLPMSTAVWGPIVRLVDRRDLASFSARHIQSIAAREAARIALAHLHVDGAVIGRLPSGAPQWPRDLVGSLSHTDHIAGAVVGFSGDWAALGLDIEPQLALPEDAVELILSGQERAALERLPGGVEKWGRALFGAKECVHKAIHPLCGAWLEFLEVRIEFQPVRRGEEIRWQPLPLSANASAALAGLQAEGRCAFSQGQVITVLGLRPAESF